MKNLLYYLIIGFLFTHEMDAVSKHEWRVLPLTSWMKDSIGYLVFLFAHIPLFAVITALISARSEKIKNRTKIAIAAFAVLHSMIHLLFSGSKDYEFGLLHSKILIFGAGLLGIIYFFSDLVKWKKSS